MNECGTKPCPVDFGGVRTRKKPPGFSSGRFRSVPFFLRDVEGEPLLMTVTFTAPRPISLFFQAAKSRAGHDDNVIIMALYFFPAEAVKRYITQAYQPHGSMWTGGMRSVCEIDRETDKRVCDRDRLFGRARRERERDRLSRLFSYSGSEERRKRLLTYVVAFTSAYNLSGVWRLT